MFKNLDVEGGQPFHGVGASLQLHEVLRWHEGGRRGRHL